MPGCVAFLKVFPFKQLSFDAKIGDVIAELYLRGATMFTQKLSEFIQRTNYQDLPREVVTAAKMAILDFIGVAMAGSQEPSGRIINEMVKSHLSNQESTVIGG